MDGGQRELVTQRDAELHRPIGRRPGHVSARRPQRERIGADALRDRFRPGAAVAERQDDEVVRHAGLHENRRAERPAVRAELDDVRRAHPDAAGGRVAHERGVVPRHLRDRIGQLLQPSVVREAAVVDRRILDERDLQRISLRRLGLRRVFRGSRRRAGHRWHGGSRRGVGQDPAPQGLTPAIGIGAEPLRRLPESADDVVGRVIVAGEKPEQRHQIAATVQRGDERLNDRGRAVERAGIAPRLQVVRRRHVPRRRARGFVGVEARIQRDRHLLERGGELEVRRGVVAGVSAGDHERADVPPPHRVGELGDRTVARREQRIGVPHGIARCADRAVQRRRGGARRRGQPVARDDDRASAMRREVPRETGDPRGVRRSAGVERRAAGDRLVERAEDGGHLARPRREPMVRRNAGGRVASLDRVDPVHRVARPTHAPPVGDLSRVPQMERTGAHRVGVDRHDEVGAREVVDRPLAGGGIDQGRVEVDAGGGVARADTIEQRQHRRRRRWLEQQPQPGAVGPRLPAQDVRIECPGALDPRRRASAPRDVAPAIRIVELQHRGLLEDPRGAETRRMVGIAFDLHGPAFAALDDQPGGVSAELHRGRIVERHAGRQFRRRPEVGNDLARWLGARRAASRQHGGAEQLHERSAGHVVGAVCRHGSKRNHGSAHLRQPFIDGTPCSRSGSGRCMPP